MGSVILWLEVLKTKCGHIVSISIVLIQPDRFIEISIRRVIVVFINCLEDDFSANSTQIHFIYHSQHSHTQVNHIWILILLTGSQTGIRESSLISGHLMYFLYSSNFRAFHMFFTVLIDRNGTLQAQY